MKDPIPPAVFESLMLYAQRGQPLGEGSFVEALMANNFLEALKRADHQSLAAIHTIAGYIYNDLPSECHGSHEVIAAWSKYARRMLEAENANDESTETTQDLNNLWRLAQEAKAAARRFNG